MLIRHSLVVLAILAGAVASPVWAQKWQTGATVRIATEGAYKPWNFRRPDGSLVGFEIDLVNTLCADLGFRCKLQTEQWGRMLPSLERGKFDIIFAGMSITAARKTKADFTEPYAATPAVFVAAPGGRVPDTKIANITLPDLDAAEQKALVSIRRAFLNGVVGVQKGTTHEIFLREYIEGYAQTRTYKNQDRLDQDTARKKLTSMLVGLGYARPLVKGDGNLGLRIVGPRISGGPFGEGIGAAVRRNNQGLAEVFSEVIRNRIVDGTVRRLSLKWFGFDLSAAP